MILYISNFLDILIKVNLNIINSFKYLSFKIYRKEGNTTTETVVPIINIYKMQINLQYLHTLKTNVKAER